MEHAVRIGLEPTFFGKVMTFFALAIFSSAAGTFLTAKFFLSYFYAQPALMYIFFIAELVIVFTARYWRAKKPLNRILFILFTFITGITLAPLVGVMLQSAAGVDILTKALLATTFMFGAAAIFGWTTKIDLSGLRGFLIIGLLGLIVVGILGLFIPWNNTAEMVYSGIGVLIFSGYTMYDFQKIKQFPEDAAIDAALALYLDIFNLFIMLLRLLSSLNRR